MTDWKDAGRNSDGKADTGKIRMSLLMTQFGELLEETAGVLTFGAEKYPKPPLDDSWKDVPDGFRRYQDALYRHLYAFLVKGEILDPESKRHHLAHAMCNLLFLYGLNEKVVEDGISPDSLEPGLYKCIKGPDVSILVSKVLENNESVMYYNEVYPHLHDAMDHTTNINETNRFRKIS